ncbi:hypothetical protein P152DRAFT_174261 [Eremomyces bilateralis CBS 781.70]|uniref:Uncharacterized protein n=1 Tax=Eremomyces bilateralis CBS 781.70 TaxID=1392243 RepID=A0A6G1FTH9_9PEZI|nr:uncharacterized protein P152DRAFT_174261 [Eremomyces bilateralis CBS 781.70]KAF1809036.1 hypothetical protein P152DRAFT_174261 [Eremomyces bilateralis CBS 781.70]
MPSSDMAHRPEVLNDSISCHPALSPTTLSFEGSTPWGSPPSPSNPISSVPQVYKNHVHSSTSYMYESDVDTRSRASSVCSTTSTSSIGRPLPPLPTDEPEMPPSSLSPKTSIWWMKPASSPPESHSNSSSSPTRRNHALRRKISPRGETLRALRAKESDDCLQRAYEKQTLAYLNEWIAGSDQYRHSERRPGLVPLC